MANEHLTHYFAQFNIELVQQDNLNTTCIQMQMPLAILIDWSIIECDIKVIKLFYLGYPVPLLIVNDSVNEEACIACLEAGADDFIVKPLNPRELHARISAISRRVTRAQNSIAPGKDILTFSNWRLIPSSRQLYDKDNTELQLSAGEYDLLLTFIQQPQTVLDREFLLQVTKNSDLNPFDRRIDVQISRLRQKIEVDPKKPILIKTIRNGGYLFTASVQALKENDAVQDLVRIV